MAKEKADKIDTAENADHDRFDNGIHEWVAQFSSQKPVDWDRIPDIELYMDQVVTFLDRQLLFQQRNSEDRIITPSMINNYTKDRVIPRAESKKYSREHIALLLVICSLKKVLSMPDLSDLLKDFKIMESSEIERFYAKFQQVQELAIARTSEIVSKGMEEIQGENEKEILRNLALQLAAEAQTRCNAAEQILGILEKKTDKKGKTDKSDKKEKSDKPEKQDKTGKPEKTAKNKASG